jgi:sulfopyruvate decarboxylase TPP-binding subunit
MISEARKTTAQYLNGLAVAILATCGGAYLAGEASALALVAAALGSLLTHLFAVWLMRREP